MYILLLRQEFLMTKIYCVAGFLGGIFYNFTDHLSFVKIYPRNVYQKLLLNALMVHEIFPSKSWNKIFSLNMSML